jgi:cation:H+ antiporter
VIVFWAVVLIVCVIGTSLSSKRAVTSALRIVEATSVSPALVGLTVMAIGTDLPEIANSIVSSATGHGDVAVGDATGSVVTQVTLTLGIICLVGGKITANRNFVISVGTAAFFGTVVVWVLAGDGELSHVDGLTLIVLWIGGTVLLGQEERRPRESVTTEPRQLRSGIGLTLLWLAAVGGFAIGMVESFLEIAEYLGVPEFIASFLALSIGTSLPELFVDLNAIKRGASSMAVGDIFGSSFVDATLAVGIGPAIFSTVVSSDVLPGTALAAGGVLLATVLVARADKYDRRLGVTLLGLYAAVVAIAVAM